MNEGKDYDEFKNFVACSQQKAVPRSEMNQLFHGNSSTAASRKANKVCFQNEKNALQDLYTSLSFSTNTKKIKKKSKMLSFPSKSYPKRPRSSMDLEREWKVFCNSPEETLRYLMIPASSSLELEMQQLKKSNSGMLVPKKLRIEPEEVPRSLCQVEIAASIMGAIIEALFYLASSNMKSVFAKESDAVEINDWCATNQAEMVHIQNFVYRWMSALVECGRFSLNLEFLSEGQKHSIVSIFRFLEITIKELERGIKRGHSIVDEGRLYADSDVQNHLGTIDLTQQITKRKVEALQKLFLK